MGVYRVITEEKGGKNFRRHDVEADSPAEAKKLIEAKEAEYAAQTSTEPYAVTGASKLA